MAPPILNIVSAWMVRLLAALSCACEIAASSPVDLLSISPPTAHPGQRVLLTGHGFGSTPGTVVLTGLRVAPTAWSDTEIQFAVPNDAVSGLVLVRTSTGTRSSGLPFRVERTLPSGQIAPYGLELEDSGLPGSAFLVETDGTCLYGISGFETLCTYDLRESQPHVFRNRIVLNQRVADLRVRGGYLFCAGDHGLLVYRCADLRAGRSTVSAAVTGASFYGVDARPDPTGERDGLLVALSEHAPRWGSSTLRVAFYHFAGGELSPLGVFDRAVAPDERQFAVALDPQHRKAYVSGWKSLTGADKFILELSTTNLLAPSLQHREETGDVLAGDMDTLDNILWAGVTATALGNELFRVYTLGPDATPLSLTRTIRGGPAFGRIARVRILDRQATVGSSWFGNRPDIFLLNTLGNTTVPAASQNSLDWAFDVTGFSRSAGTNAGKLIVADEWGGFLTLDYQTAPKLSLTHRPDYQWISAGAMTEGLHLAEGRIYVAGRGAGPWSVDPRNLSDEHQWRRVNFDWTQTEPQPNPISAVCTRRDPEAGLLIAALGHEKAMAWGTQVLALLYRETSSNIVLLAQSEALDPPGLGSLGVSAVWPEPDLVFMTTGNDGFRAYVVDPSAPSIALHRDCRTNGFGAGIYTTAMETLCLEHHAQDGRRKLIVGSRPGLLVGDPTLNIFALDYPGGVPDRDHPDRPIRVVHEAALGCTRWKPVRNFEVRPSGLVAVATSAGLGIFHLSWVPALNQMNDIAAWNTIRVSTNAYAPWWHGSWSADVSDVSFADDQNLYVVKATEGLWRLSLELDPARLAHRSMAVAYYPGVICGMDYRLMLHGWADPDIPTLHHPYGVIAEGDTAYVTGWNGKVQRMRLASDEGVVIDNIRIGGGHVEIGFFSPFGNRSYHVDTSPNLNPAQWAPRTGSQILTNGNQRLTARLPASQDPMQFYRIRVRP